MRLFFTMCHMTVLLYSISCDEIAILNYLLKNYTHFEHMVRPVFNASDPIRVHFGISLQTIINIDEKNQMIELNLWFNYKWRAHNLRWDPAKFNGIDVIRIPPTYVWVPDIILYNSADDSSYKSIYPSNLIISSNGTVLWIPLSIIKASCQINITWFPFDKQSCKMMFGSWTYSAVLFNLQKGITDHSQAKENGEWKLLNLTVSMGDENFTYLYEETYRHLIFEIHVQRRSLFYIFNLILPCLLISGLTLLGFSLPPQSGEKLTLGITIFMSLSVFSLMVTDTLPATSQAIPLIGIYFASIMIAVSMSILFTVIVSNLHHRNPNTCEMSDMTRKIFLQWLPRLLKMRRPAGLIMRRKGMSVEFCRNKGSDVLRAMLVTEYGNEDAVATNEYNHNGGNYQRDHKINHSTSRGSTGTLELLLGRINNELKIITKRIQDDDIEREIVNDWRFAALVLDRLTFIVFTILLLISTTCILCAPFLQDYIEYWF